MKNNYGTILEKKQLFNLYMTKKEKLNPNIKIFKYKNYLKENKDLILEIINLLYLVYSIKKINNMFLEELLNYFMEKTKLGRNSKNEIYIIIKFLIKTVPKFIQEINQEIGIIIRIDRNYEKNLVIRKVVEFLN